MSALKVERDGQILRLTLSGPRPKCLRPALIAGPDESFATWATRVQSCSPGRAKASAPVPTSNAALCDRPFLHENVEDAMRLYRMCEAIDRSPALSSRRCRATRWEAATGLTACRDVGSPHATRCSDSRRLSSASSRRSSRRSSCRRSARTHAHTSSPVSGSTRTRPSNRARARGLRRPRRGVERVVGELLTRGPADARRSA